MSQIMSRAKPAASSRLATLQDLSAWQRQARLGAVVSFPASVGLALLEVAITAVRAAPDDAEDAGDVFDATEALVLAIQRNRDALLSAHARHLFTGARHV
jgi:hypothetical protein